MEQKTLSAGAIPLKKTSQGWEVLLLRSFKYWDFPKGMVEPGEDPWDAALREVQEETGLTQFTLPYKKKFFETKPYAKGKVARYYVLLVKGEQEIRMIPNPITGIIEHHEYRWIDFESAKELLVPRVQEVLEWAENLLKD